MSDAEAPKKGDSLGDKTSATAWGIVFYALGCFVAGFFSFPKLAATGVQAALAEWATGRVGVEWSASADATTARIVRRALRGAAMGLGAAVLLIAIAIPTHAVSTVKGDLALTPLAIGLFAAAVTAVRDELLFHGLVLRVVGDRARILGVLACGLASAAAALGATSTGIPATAVAAAFFGGAALGAIWQRDRGAWMAWGAHTAWLWGVGPLAHDSLLDLRARPTGWGGGDAGFDAGGCAAAVLGAVAIAAIVWSRRVPTEGLTGESPRR